ncbi:ribonuclease I [Kozakia baliensis]|uniref:ribonuclease T2 family protein n=1 Tax=Kozakia baliensis TaxID=153496 RepID=UPI00345B7B02
MRLAFAVILLGFAGCTTVTPTGPALQPAAHGDFHHDTLALTWQPGFCSAGSGCLPDQPRTPLIGLHGLWASEPRSLEAQNVSVQEWWKRGCDIYGINDAPPVLDDAMQQSLSTVVPHLPHSLVTHEYNKHARCFGYQAGPFFAAANDLRLKFAQSAMGQWLAERAGLVVTHVDLLAFFDKVTSNTTPRALQLQCGKDQEGRVVLTQMWFTLRHDRLNDFPGASSYITAPENQDNCPARFLLRKW